MPSFNVHAIVDDGQDSVPWYEVGPEIYRDLVIDELTVPQQAAKIAAEIQKWGRLAALARRVWQLEERHYRGWRSAFLITMMSPEGKSSDWKKPTKDQVESAYRVEPEYHKWQERVERAEEAYNAADAMVNALRAKKDALIRYASVWHEAGAPTAV